MSTEWRCGQLTLQSGPGAPASARAAVVRWLGRSVPPDTLDDVRLVVSELVTNSCVHVQDPVDRTVRLTAGVFAGQIRVEVRDAGRDGAVLRRTPEGVGGFGLNLVAAIADRWGVDHADGTLVWCVLPATPEAESDYAFHRDGPATSARDVPSAPTG